MAGTGEGKERERHMAPEDLGTGPCVCVPFLEDYEKLSKQDNFVKNYHNYHNYHKHTNTVNNGGFGVSGFKQ